MLAWLLGLLVVMPRRFKNYVRATGDQDEFIKRAREASLWMRVFYAAYFPISLIFLAAMGAYIFGFSTIYPEQWVYNALGVFVGAFALDWVAWELVFNILSALVIGCAAGKPEKHRCWGAAVFCDCLKGYRNVSV